MAENIPFSCYLRLALSLLSYRFFSGIRVNRALTNNESLKILFPFIQSAKLDYIDIVHPRLYYFPHLPQQLDHIAEISIYEISEIDSVRYCM